MNGSPFGVDVAFRLGPVAVSRAVVVTWVVMVLLAGGAALATRHLERRPGRLQTALELFVGALDAEIGATLRAEPAPYRALIGTLFLFLLVANSLSLLPGVEAPTATLETDAALALVVLGATIVYGVRARGIVGYLRSFAEPVWLMIPVNLFGQLTRTLSMTVRLFGNVMSGAFVIAIVLSLAGLLVPIPLMALDLFSGAVQAWIFAVLATVFIGAAIDDGRARGGGTGADGASESGNATDDATDTEGGT